MPLTWRTSVWHVVNVSVIEAHWLFTCADIRESVLMSVGSVAAGSRSMVPWTSTNAYTVMLGHMSVLSVVAALSSVPCYATTCEYTPRSVLTAVQHVAKVSATITHGACTSVSIRANNQLCVNAVPHALNLTLHLVVTWEHTLLSVTVTAMSVAKAFHSAVIFVLICEYTPVRSHSSVVFVDSNLHTIVHWRSTWLDMATLLCWM